jgi:hypothetical protein
MWLGYGREEIHTKFWSGMSWKNVHLENGEIYMRITLRPMDFKEVGSEDRVRWRDCVISDVEATVFVTAVLVVIVQLSLSA